MIELGNGRENMRKEELKAMFDIRSSSLYLKSKIKVFVISSLTIKYGKTLK